MSVESGLRRLSASPRLWTNPSRTAQRIQWAKLLSLAAPTERERGLQLLPKHHASLPSSPLPKHVTRKPRALPSAAWQQRASSSQTPARAARKGGNLPPTPARTRFAPSPTGYMHLGSLRTALFSYLLAKRTGGQFILRIEDTDQKRLVPDAEARICDDLRWAGLQWDEGPLVDGPHAPYKQSERTPIYQEHATILLNTGHAYRCFCSPRTASASDSVDAPVTVAVSDCQAQCGGQSREQAAARVDAGETCTVRLRPSRDCLTNKPWKDLVYGRVPRLKRDADAEDVVLVKSDGTPTYHLANVVDDHLMHITHVIRGTEWMASTPLHLDLYRAFGWPPPAFAHVGLLTDEAGAKLSKRRADTGLGALKATVLPEALVNFLALLGWSSGHRSDVMTLDQLAQTFDLKFTKGNAVVTMEKLWYLQKHHVTRHVENARQGRHDAVFGQLVSSIVEEVRRSFLKEEYERITAGRDLERYVSLVLMVDDKAFSTSSAWVDRNRYFFAYDRSSVPLEPASYADDKMGEITGDDIQSLLSAVTVPRIPASESSAPLALAAAYANLEDKADRISSSIRLTYTPLLNHTGSHHDEKTLSKAVNVWLRDKLAYGLPGPHNAIVMALLGKDESYARRRGITE